MSLDELPLLYVVMLHSSPDLAPAFDYGANKIPFKEALIYHRCRKTKTMTLRVCVRLRGPDCDDLSGVKISVHNSV